MEKALRWGRLFRNIYSNKIEPNEKDLRRSRIVSIPEGCSARTVFTLCAGTFLAGLVKYLGAGDQLNGIIGAIPTLSGIIMLFSPIYLEKMSRRKALIAFAAFFSRILLSLMFFVPILIKDKTISLIFVVAAFLIANLSLSFITPASSNWLLFMTPESIRGRYFGIREATVLSFTSVATLGMGWALDLYKVGGNESAGFRFLFVIALTLAIINFVLISSISDPTIPISKDRLNFSELFTLPAKDKAFRRVIVVLLLWNIGFQFSAPFTAVYMVSGLKLNYTFITLTGILASLASVVSAAVSGKLAEKKSWMYILYLCVGFQAAGQIIWLFVNVHTYTALIPLAQILSGAALGGINISTINIQYTHSPESRKTVYLGFSSAIGSLVGFGSSLTGSVLLGYLSYRKLIIFGYTLSKMQPLFIVSAVLLIGCAIFIRSVQQGRSCT